MLWELPQTVLGMLLLGLERARGRVVASERREGRWVVETSGTAISLGYVVLWSRRSSRWHDLDERNREHEWGHTRQSRLLGPLYLPAGGVPSSAIA